METVIDQFKANIASTLKPVDILLDTVALTESMKKEYELASNKDKQLMVKFFLYGMIFMFGSMVMTLWSLDLPLDWLFYIKFIGGTSFSLAFAFVVGKFKEQLITTVNDPEKIKKMITELVRKIS